MTIIYINYQYLLIYHIPTLKIINLYVHLSLIYLFPELMVLCAASSTVIWSGNLLYSITKGLEEIGQAVTML